MTKILIVDDEKRVRKLVNDFLSREGFEVLEAENGKEALDIFDRTPDITLVILDVMMSEYDGWSVCRLLRKQSDVPIIMLTARGEEADELFGFELGVDEYIKKPFSPLILTARVKSLLRRKDGGPPKDMIELPGLRVDKLSHEVCVNAQHIELSPREFELLVYLLDNRAVVHSRDQLLEQVWDYKYEIDSRTVDSHIKNLRKKLLDKGAWIKTIRGFGYKFEVTP